MSEIVAGQPSVEKCSNNRNNKRMGFSDSFIVRVRTNKTDMLDSSGHSVQKCSNRAGVVAHYRIGSTTGDPPG